MVFFFCSKSIWIDLGHKALKQLKAMSGNTHFKLMNQLKILDPDDIEIYMYCGLMSYATSMGKELTLEKFEDILD
ncbi:hypothetical protein AN960_22675 [Bacillus sp. FJAT-25509]|nr:hypothetical protein AN960_22675 [Bacillus sp. FJAT-25509]